MAQRLNKFILGALRLSLIFVTGWLSLVFEVAPSYGGTFKTYPGFSMMAALATEHQWALFTGGITLVGVMAVAIQSRYLRIFSASCFCACYVLLATLLTIGRPWGTATGPYVGYAIIAITLAFAEAYVVAQRS